MKLETAQKIKELLPSNWSRVIIHEEGKYKLLNYSVDPSHNHTINHSIYVAKKHRLPIYFDLPAIFVG